MTDQLIEAVKALDERTVAVALERFTQINSHYRGADWVDVLDELFNADAHLDLTEAAPDLATAVAMVTAHYAGTLPTIQTVCRVHIPAPPAPPYVVVDNPTVLAFQEWLLAQRIYSVPGTVSVGPHMFVGDFPIEYQDRIVGWFRDNITMSHVGVQSTG